jgi:hypothetical protein
MGQPAALSVVELVRVCISYIFRFISNKFWNWGEARGGLYLIALELGGGAGGGGSVEQVI